MKSTSTLPTGIVTAVAVAVLLNYFDRGSLATAAPVLQGQLSLSSTQVGLLFSVFFWTYGPSQLVAGWLVHRFELRVVLAAGVALWALATALTGLAAGFPTILGLRLVLGLGESVTYPSWLLILSRHVPEHARGRFGALVAAGQGLGPMLGTLFGGLAMARFGWRVMFLGMGAITLLWIWPWLSLTRKGEVRSGTDSASTSIRYVEILQERSFWGAALGHFASNFPFYFVLTWLPSYLVKAGGFTIVQMAIIGSIVFGVYAVSTVLAGILSDRLIVAGYSPGSIRRTILLTGAAGCAATIAWSGLVEPRAAVWLLVLTGISIGPTSAMTGVVSATLAGPRAAGRWYAAQNLAGQVAGVIAPIVTGMIVDATGAFTAAFLFAAAMEVLAMLAWGVVIKEFAPVNWSTQEYLDTT
jgi:MFS family permease